MRKGFSLIELLVVFGLGALLLGLTISTLPRFTQRLALDNSARLIASELRALQTNAIAAHETKTFQPAENPLPSGLSYSSSRSLSFAPSGYPTVGGSGTIVLSNRFGQTKRVILSSAGRIRLE